MSEINYKNLSEITVTTQAELDLMNTKDLIEAAKFQATVKPHDEFIVEIAKRLEMLYEQINNQKAEIERLTELLEDRLE